MHLNSVTNLGGKMSKRRWLNKIISLDLMSKKAEISEESQISEELIKLLGFW